MGDAKGKSDKKQAKGGQQGETEELPPFPRDCPPGLPKMCTDLKEWGEAWEAWGELARQELALLHQAVCNLERKVYHNVNIPAGMICNAVGPIGGGPPPTDPTGPPPKPPFK